MSNLPSLQFPRRFSLRTLLIVTTAFAIWCGFVMVLPLVVNQLLIGLMWMVAGGWLVTGLVFAKGDQRAFCIGAAVVVSAMWTGFGGQLMQALRTLLAQFSGGTLATQTITLWVNLALLATLAAANGAICVRARSYFEPDSTDD